MSDAQRATPKDRRPRKTENALRRAFFDLIRERGYARTSIGDIVERADVARSTFYEHYRSKHDLLRASMAMFFEEIADSSVSPHPTRLLPAVTAHLWENRGLASVVFGGAPRAVLTRQHAAMLEQRMRRLARERGGEPMTPLCLAAQQVAEGQMALLLAWTTGRASCSTRAMAEALQASGYANVCALLRLKQ